MHTVFQVLQQGPMKCCRRKSICALQVTAAKGKAVTVSMGVMTLKLQLHEVQELTTPKNVKVFR